MKIIHSRRQTLCLAAGYQLSLISLASGACRGFGIKYRYCFSYRERYGGLNFEGARIATKFMFLRFKLTVKRLVDASDLCRDDGDQHQESTVEKCNASRLAGCKESIERKEQPDGKQEHEITESISSNFNLPPIPPLTTSYSMG